MKTNTHVVIKRKWLTENLNQTEREIFYLLLKKARNNKPDHSYYVVNLDEPYAEKVKELILGEERDINCYQHFINSKRFPELSSDNHEGCKGKCNKE